MLFVVHWFVLFLYCRLFSYQNFLSRHCHPCPLLENSYTESSMFWECLENVSMYERRRHVLLSLRVSGLTPSFPVALSARQYKCLACGVHDGPSSGCLVIRLLPAMLLSVAKHRLCLFHLSMGCVPRVKPGVKKPDKNNSQSDRSQAGPLPEESEYPSH